MRRICWKLFLTLAIAVSAVEGARADDFGFSANIAGGNALGNKTSVRGMSRYGAGLSFNYLETDLFLGAGAAMFDQVPDTEGSEGYLEFGTQLRVYPLGSWGCRWACPYGTGSVGLLWEMASDARGDPMPGDVYDWFVTATAAGGVEFFPVAFEEGTGQFSLFAEVGRLWTNGDGPDADLAPAYQDWRHAPYVLFGFRVRSIPESVASDSGQSGDFAPWLLFSFGSAGFFGGEGPQIAEMGGTIGLVSRHGEIDWGLNYARVSAADKDLRGFNLQMRFYPDSVPAGKLALWPYGAFAIGGAGDGHEGRGHSYIRFLAGAGLELAVVKPSERRVGLYIEADYAASEARVFQNALGSPHAFCLRGGVRFRFGK